MDKPVPGWQLAVMLTPRIIFAAALALALTGCATCFPSMEKREASPAAAQSGVISIPGNPVPPAQ